MHIWRGIPTMIGMLINTLNNLVDAHLKIHISVVVRIYPICLITTKKDFVS